MEPMMLRRYFGGSEPTWRLDRSYKPWQQPDTDYYSDKVILTGKKRYGAKNLKRSYRKRMRNIENREWRNDDGIGSDGRV